MNHYKPTFPHFLFLAICTWIYVFLMQPNLQANDKSRDIDNGPSYNFALTTLIPLERSQSLFKPSNGLYFDYENAHYLPWRSGYAIFINPITILPNPNIASTNKLYLLALSFFHKLTVSQTRYFSIHAGFAFNFLTNWQSSKVFFTRHRGFIHEPAVQLFYEVAPKLNENQLLYFKFSFLRSVRTASFSLFQLVLGWGIY